MKGIQELNPLGYLDPYKLIYIVKIKNIYAQKIQGGKNPEKYAKAHLKRIK